MSSEILNVIRSGGFVNPYERAVSVFQGTLMVPTQAEFALLTNSQFTVAGQVPPPVQTVTNAYNSIVNTVNSIGSLTGHTDKLSGVDLTGDSTLATIAKTMGSARKANGELACSSVIAAFGSLSKVAELIQETEAAVNDAKALLADTVNNINSVPDKLQQFASKVANQILADEAAFAQAKLDLVQQAVASSIVELVDDECFGSILGNVMNQQMTEEVNKVKTAARAAANKARYGF